MSSRQRPWLLVMALLVAGILALAAETAFAADNRPAVNLTLTGQAQSDGGVVLEAKALKATGGVVSNQNIDFFVVADFFMEGPVLIGSGTTDGRGVASTTYRPTWSGNTKFSASYSGDGALAPAKGSVELSVRSTTADYHPAPRDLSQLRQTAGRAAIMVALAVWALLLTVIGRVFWIVRRPAPAELPQGTPASSESR